MNRELANTGIAKRLRNLVVAGSMAMLLAATVPATAFAQNAIKLNGSGAPYAIKIAAAQPRTFSADASFSEIVVGDPEVALVTPLTDRTFYVIGSKQGVTGVALYNEAKELVGTLDIEVGPDTGKLNQALAETLRDSSVQAKSANGRVVISGRAKNPAAAAKALDLAKQYDADAINSTSVEGSTQVQLEVRFIEASRRKDKEFGIGLFPLKDNGRFYGSTGALSNGAGSFTNSLISGALPFGQIVGNLLAHGLSVDVLVQALEQKGMARRLAEPNLVALSGDTASFLAGGEFPVPVSTDDGQVTVEFKKFGVGLDFTPTVLDNGLINLQIAPEVSQIDPTTSVRFNDIEIPGLVVRRAKTTVELRDGQSFVLAGLLQSTGNYDVRKFPWLGDIPILGVLFRSSSYRKSETDLVIIVTPRLVRPLEPGARIASPLDSAAPPNDVDLFWKGKTEIGRANLRRLAQAESGEPKAGHVIDY